MVLHPSRLGPLLALVLAGSAGLAACGGGAGNTGGGSTTHSGHTGTGGAPTTTGTGGDVIINTGGGHTGGQHQGFEVLPAAAQTLTVDLGATNPTVDYAATLDGAPISAGWGVDNGSIGTIAAGPSSAATFVPTGKAGGTVTITAGLNGQTVTRQVLVKLTGTQNGPNTTDPGEAAQIPGTPADLTAGGGVGGVGGEGLGVAVSDPAVITALGAPTGDGGAQGLKLLYPYDKTVWPRGLPAPLLQWDWSVGDADAVQIELSTTTGSFSWKGTFGKPAILAQTGGKFTRHPIPQDVWDAATNTAGGLADQLTVKLTVAQGGQAYGPIAETWTIAPARLSGIIYYQSYGTELAKNLGGAVGGDHLFGGAVLSIHAGDTGPKLTAGGNGATSQCRVCHSVASGGSRLVVQHGENYGVSAAYDLAPTGATEHAMATGATFPGVSPDGSLALSPSGQVLSLPAGTPVASSGLAAVATNLGTPTFSPDGKRVAFNPMSGPAVSAPAQMLMVMDFDVSTMAFANPVTVASDSGAGAGVRPGWPAFFPDGQSVIFEHQSAAGVDGAGGDLHTRKGAKGQIAWTNVTDASAVTALNQLNGLDAAGNVYLPKLAQPVAMSCTGDGAQVGNLNPDHGDDVNLNYEPTVAPVAAGGYAWVVFTSRRMYGSVAKIPPFCSDPRGVDLISNITPKKLWVAAVDITGKPGNDASHPAFYLPGQEILAGNSRGFWTLDPCRQDGEGCEHGDECCNGYCEPSGQGGALVCSNTPPQGSCSKPQEKCSTAGDCCDQTNLCINGFCTQKGPS
jgi:hypothetical protein